MSQLLAYSLAPCTKSDTVNAPNFGGGIPGADGFLITGAGNVSFISEIESSPITLVAVPVNTVIPLRCQRINSSLTTATGLYYAYQRLP